MTGLFLDDFEAEARLHIEKIETAFLEADTLSDDPKLMNSVFRSAHSLKGTAGFFSLAKIVAVAHELESVLSQIKEGILIINDDIIEVILKSIDCLKELVDNLQDDADVETEQAISALKKYSVVRKQDHQDFDVEAVAIPFDLKDDKMSETLKNAAKRGQKAFYINISFNRSLGRYYEYPELLIGSILSVGTIVEALISSQVNTDKEDRTIKGTNADLIMDELVKALNERDTSTLEMLVTSVLDLELFLMAIEIDKKFVRLLSRDTILQTEGVQAAQKPKPAADAVQPAKKPTQKTGNFSIRLDISTINGLVDLANEMILTRNQLSSTIADYKDTIADLAPILHNLNRLTTEIQEKVMYTRMQPISVIFSKFPRIIHDTARALNKDIAVEILNDDVTLDKYMLEALTDPITQLVKNSADHGVETAEQRADSRKPKKGVITLNAFMQDGSAIIEIRDDGAGIDKNALIKKALERGIATEETLSAMHDSEIYDLMFEPGISTADQVTNLSGRGVGMDIVKTNIERLGGSIEIESETGTGTTVRLNMPITLSVTRTLIVMIGSIPYAVPEINVERIVRICGNTDTKHIERINNNLVLSLDGRFIPVVTMREIENKARGMESISAEALLERTHSNEIVKCLIMRSGGRSFALVIDDALETEQILVKPLPLYLQSCSCYSNVTVLGSGNAVTVLDAEGIIRFMGIENIDREIAGATASAAESTDMDEADGDEKQLIVFKCSGPEYFAIETRDISRIEVVLQTDIQEIGTQQFINIAGETVRIIRPEAFAPVKKRTYTEEKLYMLVLKNCKSPIGLLVGKVLDKIEGVFTLDTEQFYSDFVYGTCVYNEKVIIFMDPASITADMEYEKAKKRIVKKAVVK